MGEGNQIKFLITLGGNVLSSNRNEERSDDKAPRDENRLLKSPKENAPNLFARKWQHSEANNRRNNLLERLPHQARETSGKHSSSQDNQTNTSRETGHGRSDNLQQPRSENNFRGNHENSIQQHTENINKSVQDFTNRLEHSTNQLLRSLENSARQTINQVSQSFPATGRNALNGGLDNINRHTFESLFAVAREHRDFREFQNQPKEFWNQVRQMSEVRVVETFVRGNFETRVVSRYGELLERFGRQGGGLERFVSSLSPGEAGVFVARYQIEKSFGANKFFVGNGVVLTERGEFSLQTFLTNTGRNLRLSPSTILSLLGGNPQKLSNQMPTEKGGLLGHMNGSYPAEEVSFYQNIALTIGRGKVLLNTTSAALLGLSLALYQNAGAWLSLENLAAQILLPQMPREQNADQIALPKNALDERTVDDTSRQEAESGDAGIAALINGALTSIEKYRKSAYESVGLWADAESDQFRFRFAAGATGAIMSATIGCITPLAGKAAGETLGFAASIVVGLNDGGLRTFGASTLVSIITENVQTLLNVTSVTTESLSGKAADKLLNEAEPISISIDDLQQSLFNRRINAFITS